MGGHIAHIGVRRGVYRVFVGIPAGKRPGVDGRIMYRWIFRKLEEGIDWIDWAKDRGRWRALVNVVMNLRVSKNAGNFLTS
jgi:hypothetical protein